MLHPSRYVVYYEASDLLAAPKQEKQDMLGFVLDGMLKSDLTAGTTALCLVNDLAPIEESNEKSSVSYDSATSHGELHTRTTLRLLNDNQRLQGFVSAIKRWPEQEAVLDVGSGPFPVLALAAAMYNPKAEVTAVEISSDSP